MNSKFILTAGLVLFSGVAQAHNGCNAASVEQAAQNCNYKQMKHALKHSCGADLGAALMQSLKCTGKDEAYYLAKLLLEHGAPVNKADKAGRTGLMLGMIACNKYIVELFHKNNANVCARDNAGKTAADLKPACCDAQRIERALRTKCN